MGWRGCGGVMVLVACICIYIFLIDITVIGVNLKVHKE